MVFSQIETILSPVTCQLFVEDLEFLTAACNIDEARQIGERARKIVLNLEANNSVRYDMSKTEPILFLKA